MSPKHEAWGNINSSFFSPSTPFLFCAYVLYYLLIHLLFLLFLFYSTHCARACVLSSTAHIHHFHHQPVSFFFSLSLRFFLLGFIFIPFFFVLFSFRAAHLDASSSFHLFLLNPFALFFFCSILSVLNWTRFCINPLLRWKKKNKTKRNKEVDVMEERGKGDPTRRARQP